MHRHLRKILFLLFPLVVFGLAAAYFELNEGFAGWKIRSNEPFCAEWELPSLEGNQREALQPIFAKRFKYLAKGLQSYCFVSEDGQYVLKFIKQHDCRSLWSHFLWLPLPTTLRQHAKEQIEKAEIYKTTIYNSYRLAYTSFKEESGLIYLQFNQKPIADKKIYLIDKLGLPHAIDLNRSVFVLQKRAELAIDRIDRLMKEERLEDAKEAITALCHLFYKRSKKGIRDQDMGKIFINYGFIGDLAVSIDIGQYVADDEIKKEDVLKEEISERLGHFKKWLRRYPPLFEYTEDLEARQFETL